VARKLRIRNLAAKEDPVVIIRSSVLARDRTVYFQVADKPISYELGRNRIVYIGATGVGSERIMSSIAERIPDAFKIHGVNTIEVHEIACAPRQRIKTWRVLERACLLVFKETYGQPPRMNTHGIGLWWTNESKYFDLDQLRRVMRRYEKP